MKEIAAQEASTLVVIVGGGFGQDEFISLTEKGVPMKYSVKMNLCLGPFRMTGGTRR
jgi:hypothetical protein